MQREPSQHNPRRAALCHDGRRGIIQVKADRNLPPEEFQVTKDGRPVTDVEFRRVDSARNG